MLEELLRRLYFVSDVVFSMYIYDVVVPVVLLHVVEYLFVV